MTELVLLTDVAAARGLGPALAGLHAARIVAFDPRCATEVPRIDFVYPLELPPGTPVPGPLAAALAADAGARVILAPAGALESAPLPTLLVDLGQPFEAVAFADPAEWADVEAVARTAARRDVLEAAGVLVIEVLPDWYAGDGRLAPQAGAAVAQRLAALAGRAAGAETVPAATYRSALRGRSAVVLVASDALGALGPDELATGTFVATPDTLDALHDRMGIAQFACVAAPCRGSAAAALRRHRGVLVHAAGLHGPALAPLARAYVPVRDLARDGGPSLGWSDDLARGFFPGAGDPGLALQWTGWLGPARVSLAGSPADDAFRSLAGAAATLARRRGIAFEGPLP